jgi:uncharacterized protein (TIGR03437 family)
MIRWIFLPCVLAPLVAAQPLFKGQELLGRVTDSSVTLNVAADKDLDAYIEYGTASGSYSAKTPTARYTGGTPFEIVLDGLKSNARYYYRMLYREAGATVFTPRSEHTFQTQRPRGSTFTFAVQFDPHMDENSDPDTYRLTLANALADKPDFLIDLGDNMMSDKLQQPTAATVLDRVLLLRSYYDLICHSAPLYMVLGNHEGEWGRFLDGTANNVAVWDTQYRKQYYPNPIPDRFYSGDTRSYPLVGQRQAYYSWEWGDALFVVLDAYWNQPSSPDASGDWSLTLGREQYAWLKKTLETSAATFKFVFCHNLVGGLNMNGPMRGGIEAAKYLEWGGYNLDGTWGFDKARPGWAMPIHQLLVANNVTTFFHGHDHVYAKQDLDGIVYQEGPQPSAKNTSLGNRAIDYGYTHGTTLGGAGYLRVQVSPAAVKVEYIQTWTPANESSSRKNGMAADSYTIPARRTNLKAVSGASFSGGTVAPDAIVSAFGESLPPGPVTVTDSGGAARTAQVLGAVSTQVNFVVPSATAPGRAAFAVGSGLGDLLVEPVSPGLFSANANGQGVAAALAVRLKSGGAQTVETVFQCGASGCATVPLDLGPASDQVYLSLFGTGLRHFSNQAIATVGGAAVSVAGPVAQSEFAGLDQVNLGPLPRSLAGRGEVDIVLAVDGKAANTVTVSLK